MLYDKKVYLFKHQIYGSDDKHKGEQVVPFQGFALEHNVCNKGKHDKAYALLHHLELYQRERAAVALEANAVGWHLATILKEGNAPREGNDAYQWPVA